MNKLKKLLITYQLLYGSFISFIYP